MIKFSKKLSQYSYVLAFDLAKHLSGYSLIDINNNKVLLAGVIDTEKAHNEFVWDYFYNQVINVMEKCLNKIGANNAGSVFITKERLPNQNGRFSTILTLQGLAQAHAVFDLAATHSGIDIYDYDGVHSTSVKAYFKTLTGIDKPQKEDIAKYIQDKFNDFNFKDYSLDVTDSVAVALTLINKKWNVDITEKIKEIKKEIRDAKSQTKVNKLSENIKFLEGLKK